MVTVPGYNASARRVERGKKGRKKIDSRGGGMLCSDQIADSPCPSTDRRNQEKGKKKKKKALNQEKTGPRRDRQKPSAKSINMAVRFEEKKGQGREKEREKKTPE